MRELRVHKTPQDFLDSNCRYLEKNELENNLPLGLTFNIEDKTKEYKDYYFISVIEEDRIEAVSISTSPRVVITGNHKNDKAIKLIADYYREFKKDTGGVIGEEKISQKFADEIKLKQIKKRGLIVHNLLKTSDLKLSNGFFEKSKLKNADLLSEFRMTFDNETFGNVRTDYKDLKADTESKIKKGALYNWIDKGRIVSIAAVMRKTKNIGIIGLVYTPEQFRGNGYATSTVLSLSNVILNNGFSECGLFTDKSNPTSNHIYYKIGYRPKIEFSDIYFM